MNQCSSEECQPTTCEIYQQFVAKKQAIINSSIRRKLELGQELQRLNLEKSEDEDVVLNLLGQELNVSLAIANLIPHTRMDLRTALYTITSQRGVKCEIAEREIQDISL